MTDLELDGTFVPEDWQDEDTTRFDHVNSLVEDYIDVWQKYNRVLTRAEHADAWSLIVDKTQDDWSDDEVEAYAKGELNKLI